MMQNMRLLIYQILEWVCFQQNSLILKKINQFYFSGNKNISTLRFICIQFVFWAISYRQFDFYFKNSIKLSKHYQHSSLQKNLGMNILSIAFSCLATDL